MNRGVQGVDQGRLAAAGALHSETSLRLIEARERAEAKSARMAFMRPAARAGLALVDNRLGAMPAFRPRRCALTQDQEEDLRSGIDAQVQKVLSIMAVMISEAEADVGAMNELLDIIASMDRDFFDFANDPENIAIRHNPPALLAAFIARRRKKLI